MTGRRVLSLILKRPLVHLNASQQERRAGSTDAERAGDQTTCKELLAAIRKGHSK